VIAVHEQLDNGAGELEAGTLVAVLHPTHHQGVPERSRDQGDIHREGRDDECERYGDQHHAELDIGLRSRF